MGPWEPWTYEDGQSVLQCKNTLQIAPPLHYETHLKMGTWSSRLVGNGGPLEGIWGAEDGMMWLCGTGS
ncbi:hypothetical protein CFP56_003207 [Quercus suber]|uniref:Uncharacterized protein n=1 Tax=Quercus suber TaxID=58331 RepID=A0AAW0IJ36_QUESU